ncbi:hypothetical protein WDU94_015568 [Cyamophila willieti]
MVGKNQELTPQTQQQQQQQTQQQYQQQPLLGPPNLTAPSMDMQISEQEPGTPCVTNVNPLMTPTKTQQRAANPEQALEEDMKGLEEIKAFFGSWVFPPNLDNFKKALYQLLHGFERTLLEQKSKAAPAPTQMNFSTDEDELTNETAWVDVQGRRKRRKKNPDQQRINNKPPPIKVETKDVKALTNLAQVSSGEGKFAIKTINQKIIKVNCEEEQGYRNLVSSLKQNNVSYYTYENKQTRPIRVAPKKVFTCTKERTVRPTCANCKKDHPANYRGCVIAKEAQIKRNQQRKAATQAKQPAKNNQPIQKPPQRTVHPNKIFSDVAGPSSPPASQDNTLDMSSMLNLILNEVKSVKLTVANLSQRVDTIERQISGRKSQKPI